MASRWTLLALTLHAALLTGCNAGNQDKATVDQLTQLQTKVKELSTELASVKFSVELASSAADAKANAHPEAEFDPSSPTFQLLDTGVVTLAVSVVDVKPMADGSRITFHFGNPTSATVNDLELTLTYGSRVPSFDKMPDWQKGLQTVEKSLTAAIRPGSWNPQQVTLPKVRPENLGYIKVAARASSISLNTK